MIKIGILMGGPFSEREVSFNSGRTICDYIDRYTYEPIPLFIDQEKNLFILPWKFLHRGKISDFENRLLFEAKKIFWHDLPQYIDFVFLALHGAWGEDGAIQGFLTILGIPFSGSQILTHAIAFNKSFTAQSLSFLCIEGPEYFLIKKNFYYMYDEINAFLRMHKKIILKPNKEGSSIGTLYIDSEKDLKEFFNTKYKKNTSLTNFIYTDAKSHYSNELEVMVQKYIQGVEFCIIALEKNGEWILFQPTEIIFEKNIFSYREKYLPGGITKFTPGRFSQKIIQKIHSIVKKIIDYLNPFDLIRIDGIIEKDTNKIFIIDINTFPGTAPSSFLFLQSGLAGLTPTEVISIIIENNFKRLKKKFLSQKHKSSSIKKVKIAVLCGGSSSEKEISLESGRNAYYKLSREFFDPIPIFVSGSNQFYRLETGQIVKDTTKEIELSLKESQRINFDALSNEFNFVFLGLHGGHGEDGTLQKKLEEKNIIFNGSGSLTSSICMDKNRTMKVLDEHGICTTARILLKKDVFMDEQKISFIKNLLRLYKKVVIKPNSEGCSISILIESVLSKVLNAVHSVFSKGYECLVEGYIIGEELTVGVLGNGDSVSIVLPITKIVKNKDLLSLEEKFLPGEGENITPASFSSNIELYIKDEISKIYSVLGCSGYARIDCFWMKGSNKLIILEVNTLPGITPATCIFHQAAEVGLHPAQFFQYIVYLAYKKREKLTLLSSEFLSEVKIIENILDSYISNKNEVYLNKSVNLSIQVKNSIS